MARAKRRIVAVLLVAFALWPLLHYRLVQRYGLDPWKFGGWAMYVTPAILPSVEIFSLRDEDRVKTPLIGSRLEPAAQELARFRKARHFWGQLEQPDRLGALIGAALGSSQRFEIVVIDSHLDAASARLVSSRESFFFPTPPGAPARGE